MLEKNLATQLRQLLDNLKRPVELLTTVEADATDATTRETLELCAEIAEMSELVTAREAEGDERAQRTPSFTIRAADDHAAAVTFSGLPMGHEFTSLVLALLNIGGHPSKAAAATIEQVRNIRGEHHFETFFSQSCQNCPDVVQALDLMATLNPGITHTAIDGSAFPDEADERGVMAVPTVFLDGEDFGSGRMTLEEIVERIDDDAAQAAADRLSEADPYEVLVLGGGPAGATAAIYAARKGIRTGLVAERMGGQVNDTMSIENLSGTSHTEGPQLSAALERHVNDYEVDLVKSQVAIGVTTAGTEGGHHSVEFASGATLRTRSLVIATGASWRTMGVPGEEEYRNKGVTFCPHCDGPLFKGKRVAVIGGGNSGVEAAIDLAGIVGHVTVLEFMDSMRADQVLQDKLRSLPNVDIVLGAATQEVVGDGSRVTGLRYELRETGEAQQLDLEGVFVQIGLVPNSAFLKDSGIELTDRGEVVIDERGATNVPGVFAAGDVATTPYKQIVVAFGSGSTASLSAFDHLIRTSAPSQGDAEDTAARTKVVDADAEPTDVADTADASS
ncbi:alkyl hydroperoxide reductase subunit F [Kytococcus schroeteri]|uniref:Alkyl hydroperoxide reductase subunit F n=1 Tax=Kytococcus schroeteri TaxID=138300 RepID=A0A2I1PB36_9MICO|nr:alkyl hydroperoxide reductase subunit F [Kytococcus schroeteri]PKZ41810.1 alkyl hydroperoxide reductase subunit F [Kytococcus schroeteri]